MRDARSALAFRPISTPQSWGCSLPAGPVATLACAAAGQSATASTAASAQRRREPPKRLGWSLGPLDHVEPGAAALRGRKLVLSGVGAAPTMTAYESAAAAPIVSLARVRRPRPVSIEAVCRGLTLNALTSTSSPSVGERCPPVIAARSCPAAAEADGQPARDLRALLQRRSDLIRPRVLAADGVGESAAQQVEEVRASGSNVTSESRPGTARATDRHARLLSSSRLRR